MKNKHIKMIYIILCLLIILPVHVYAAEVKDTISLTDSNTVYTDGLQGPVKSITTYTKSAIPTSKDAYSEYDKAGFLQFNVQYKYSNPPKYCSYIHGKLSEVGEVIGKTESRTPVFRYQYFKPAKDLEVANVILVNPSQGQQNLFSQQYTKRKNGVILEKGIIDSDGSPREIYSYEYIPNNTIKITATYLQYKATAIEFYATDKVYRMIKIFHLGRMKDPFKENSIEENKYDGNLQQVQWEKEDYRKEKPVIQGKSTTKYEIISSDKFGNWTERKVTSYGSVYEIRQILYYQ